MNDDPLGIEPQKMPLQAHAFKAGPGQFVRRLDRNVFVFQGNRPVEPLPLPVANLKEISARTEYRMLPEFVANFWNGELLDLLVHEARHPTHAVAQLVVCRVI